MIRRWIGILAAVAVWGLAGALVEASQSFVLLHTTGLAGRADRLLAVKGVADRFRAAGEAVLLVDAGNTLNSAEAALRHDKKASLTVDLMNRAGYDVWLPGAAEFGHVIDDLTGFFREAEFPIVGANLLSPMTGRPPFQVQPYAIVPLGRMRIGFIGVSVGGGDIGAADPAVSLKHYLPSLVKRSHLVVVLSQAGPAVDSVLAGVEGVDAVVGLREMSGSPYVKVGKATVGYTGLGGQTIGRMEFAISDSGAVTVEGMLVPLEPEAFVDEAVSALQGWTAEVGGEILPVTNVLASCDGGFSAPSAEGSAMGFLIADLMRGTTGADIGLVSGTSLHPVLAPGPVRVVDLMRVYPGENGVAVYEVKGSDIVKLMEAMAFRPAPSFLFSGIQAVYRKVGDGREVSMTVNEQELDPDRTYKVAVEAGTKIARGPMAALVRGLEPEQTAGGIRDLLADHMSAAGVIRGSLDGRLVLVGEE